MLNMYTRPTIRADVISIRREILRAVQILNERKDSAIVENIVVVVECNRRTFERHIRYLIDHEYVTCATARTRGRTNHYSITQTGQEYLKKCLTLQKAD